MGLAMQAAADAGIPFVVLDRPNPLGGWLIDGNLRSPDQVSFVSQYPIPAIHGLTAGELALAIKGEGWLDGLEELELSVVELTGWDRASRWPDTGLQWHPPSPGLPTAASADTYPAVVLFEATTLSFGRGTDHPFQQIGAPWLDAVALADELNGAGLSGVRFIAVTFSPAMGESSVVPAYLGQDLPGVRLEVVDGAAVRQFEVGIHLMHAVLAQARALTDPPPEAASVVDRPEFLDLLTGSADVRRALLAGEAPETIVSRWAGDLDRFELTRAKYLLY
jgi:uncharacterized protein YbbC (DUF1343 family)